MYAALPSGCGSRSGGCGECAEVCGAKGCVVVKVIDTCASCSCGDIDLSTDALKASTGYSWDRKHVTWKWTSCSGGSSVSSDTSNSTDESSDSKREVRSNTVVSWLSCLHLNLLCLLLGLPHDHCPILTSLVCRSHHLLQRNNNRRLMM
jgi:hypothetical protein